MGEREIGDMFSEWEVMFNILSSKIRGDFCITDLAREIEIYRFSPLFNKVLKFMIEKKLIIVKKITGSSKMLYINYSELETYLRQRKPFLIIEDFIHKTNKLAIT